MAETLSDGHAEVLAEIMMGHNRLPVLVQELGVSRVAIWSRISDLYALGFVVPGRDAQGVVYRVGDKKKAAAALEQKMDEVDAWHKKMRGRIEKAL